MHFYVAISNTINKMRIFKILSSASTRTSNIEAESKVEIWLN